MLFNYNKWKSLLVIKILVFPWSVNLPFIFLGEANLWFIWLIKHLKFVINAQDVLKLQTHKDIHFTVLWNKDKKKILTAEVLEPPNVSAQKNNNLNVKSIIKKVAHSFSVCWLIDWWMNCFSN